MSAYDHDEIKESILRTRGTGWSQADEMLFLKRLGTWRPPEIACQRKMTQKQLIRGYIKGLKQRQVMGGMRKIDLLKCARAMLHSQ